jgi:hypothetical protein
MVKIIMVLNGSNGPLFHFVMVKNGYEWLTMVHYNNGSLSWLWMVVDGLEWLMVQNG